MSTKQNEAGRRSVVAPALVRPPDAAGTWHEPQAQPNELERHNRELRRTQLELAKARDRYRDLYDRAPVGYLTLDERGRILEANLTAARLLAQDRDSLQRRPLSAYMVQPDADRWHQHVKEAFRLAAPWRIELRFRRPDGELVEVQVDGLLVARGGDGPGLRVTLTDVTLPRLADADRRAARQAVSEQEADRRRVARELHDDLGQRLSALKMNLAARVAGAVTDADLAAMVRTIDDAMVSVRRMTTDLRPLMLDDLGLAAAIEALARRSARQHGMKLRLHLTAADPPPGDPAAVTLYRLLQASLPLLAGQPGPGSLGSMRIELRDAPGARLLAMQCQRRTCAPGAAAAQGPERWTALREAAHLMGYTLDVAAVRPGGERVTVRMPLPTAEAVAAPV
ncbi:MAG: histidine kinase [Rubrivivax sp.]|nr:histidine kinase [Rubrivivax sp.]